MGCLCYFWEIREQFDFLVLSDGEEPRNANEIVTIFLYFCPHGGHLEFQNGRHLHHILAYISISDPQIDLKMVAIPLFVVD